MFPISCCRRVASTRRSSAVRKLPTSQARPCDSKQSLLGCRAERGASSLTLVQCRANLVFACNTPSCELIVTNSAVIAINSRCRPRRIEQRSASHNKTNSSPANGNTGQNPAQQQYPAVMIGPIATVIKNQRTWRSFSELCAHSSMRTSSGCSARRDSRARPCPRVASGV